MSGTRAVRAARAVAGAALLATLALAPRAAHAVYQCGDQTDDCTCGAPDPYPCCDNGGNCTWWAWEAACCNWAAALPSWGNANQWRGNALTHPDYEVLDVPVVGSIANRLTGTYGHVAWVIGINGLELTVTEENCCTGCNYGLRTFTYGDWHYFDGGFIVRAGQCACVPGETAAQECGRCGQQERACGDDCAWGEWGACTGEGACAPAQTETAACGDCGEQSRTCDDACAWGEWGACAGPDPTGGSQVCDTGEPGMCKSGLRRCVDGTLQCARIFPPSPEACDGLDNNCDGEIDEGATCPDGGFPWATDGGHDAADAGPAAYELTGACGCRAGDPATAPLGLLLLVGLMLGRRRP